MTPDERLQLTRLIPPDLVETDVVMRHGNGMLAPSAPCWFVTIRGQLVPGFYSPEDAAKLCAQILHVSKMRAMFDQIEAQPLPVSTWCPLCGDFDASGRVCAPCVEAYRLATPRQMDLDTV